MERATVLLRLPHRVDSGDRQMVLDAALLGWAARGDRRAVFRTYGWSRPTLSLGRAEPFPGAWNREALEREGVDVVRRPTGGSGVLHDEELTFAAAASLPGPWRLSPRDFSNLVADSLSQALQRCGVPAERIAKGEASPVAPASRGAPVACFARSDRGEVRVGPFKVAGIASRFTRGAVLSHASVPLSPRHRDVARFRSDDGRSDASIEQHARSVTELLGQAIDPLLLGEYLGRSLAQGLGVDLLDAELEELELGGEWPDAGVGSPGKATLARGPLV